MVEISEELAGKLFTLLKENQELSVTQLTESIPGKSSEIFLALGLLARESIIVYRAEKNITYVSLAE